jgi:exosortase
MAHQRNTRRSDWLWIGGLSLAFAPALLTLSSVWLAYDYYSHGFLVPLVAFWMFHAERPKLPPPGADPRGLIAIVLAVVVYVGGLLLADATLQGLALVGVTAGVALRLWGPAGLRRVAFPLGFLLFMVPIPSSILTPAILELQLTVSVAAVELLHTVGFTVLREGNVVLLPGDERLFVDEACSGITSIVTLLPLGFVLAYFTEKAALRRALIVLAVVPLAGAQVFGVEQATSGAVHDLAGVLTFAFACMLLIGFGGMLRLLPQGPQSA